MLGGGRIFSCNNFGPFESVFRSIGSIGGICPIRKHSMLGLKYLGQWNKWDTIPWISSGCTKVKLNMVAPHRIIFSRKRTRSLCCMILQLAKIVQGQVVGPPSERSTLIAHPHLLVRATNERFLPTWATFRLGLASKCKWAISVHLGVFLLQFYIAFVFLVLLVIGKSLT
jgi:hypothetical protein